MAHCNTVLSQILKLVPSYEFETFLSNRISLVTVRGPEHMSLRKISLRVGLRLFTKPTIVKGC